jgi:hypothetical protein
MRRIVFVMLIVPATIALLAGCGGTTGQPPTPAASSSSSALSAADREYLSALASDSDKLAESLTLIQKKMGTFSSWTAKDGTEVGRALATINVTYETWHARSSPSSGLTGVNDAWQEFLNVTHHFSVTFEAGVTSMSSTKLEEAVLWFKRIQGASNAFASQLDDADIQLGLY